MSYLHAINGATSPYHHAIIPFMSEFSLSYKDLAISRSQIAIAMGYDKNNTPVLIATLVDSVLTEAAPYFDIAGGHLIIVTRRQFPSVEKNFSVKKSSSRKWKQPHRLQYLCAHWARLSPIGLKTFNPKETVLEDT
jgi:hypothetical protein